MQKITNPYLSSGKLDLMGIGTSVLCSVHCALLPLLVSSLPLAGINLLENKWIEYGMIALAFVIGSISFYAGCFKKHKNKKPLAMFIAGFAVLLLNQIQEHVLVITTASLLIITAHLWNYRLSSAYKRCRLKAISPLA